MSKSVISRWAVWAIETAQESKQIADYFENLKQTGQKKKLFAKASQFFKFIDNVHALPNLIMDSGQIPEEWKRIDELWSELIADIKQELNLLDEEAEALLVQWIKAGKELGKAIEMTVMYANAAKPDTTK